MWRSSVERAESAQILLAHALWGWAPRPRQRELFTSPAQVTIAACGRRWGKTEALGVDVATLPLADVKTVTKSPKRQAQIDAIEGQVDTVLSQVQAALPATPDSQGSPGDPDGAGTLALRPLPPSSQASAPGAQGGAS